MKRINKILIGLGLGIFGLFIAGFAYAVVFNSFQLAPTPSNGNCLTTNGSINAWSASCGGGGGSGGGWATSTPNIIQNAFGDVVGINSSTPWSTLVVEGTSTQTSAILTVASSTHASILTVLSDGNIRIGTTTASQILLTDANNNIQSKALGGDATLNYTNGSLTLATVNSNVGTFGTSGAWTQYTVNAKGLMTAASNIIPTISTSTAGNVFNIATTTTNLFTLTLPVNLLNNVATGTAGNNFNISTSTLGTGMQMTINLPNASTNNSGQLTSTDWNTFNGKQAALTNPVTGTGSNGNCVQWTGTNTVGAAGGACGTGGSGNSAFTLGLGFIYNATSTDQVLIGESSSSTNATLEVKGTGTNPVFQLSTSTGAEILRVTAAGNMGINSTTPNATLVVQGTTTQPSLDILRVASSTNATYLAVSNTGKVGVSTTTSTFVFAVAPNGNATANQTAFFQDLTPSTGSTNLAVRAGPGQSNQNGIMTQAAAGTTSVLIRADASVVQSNTFEALGTNAALVEGNSSGATTGDSVQLTDASSRNPLSGAANSIVNVQGTFAPGSGSGVFASTMLTTTINQNPGATGISRGLYVNPTITNAKDFRGFETAAYTVNTSQTTLVQNILFGQPNYASTTALTVPNAYNVVIGGAPRATGNNGITITSSSALTILSGNSVATTTNAYGLFLQAPTGAGTNYAASFNGGNFGIGTAAPTSLLTVDGTANITGDCTGCAWTMQFVHSNLAAPVASTNYYIGSLILAPNTVDNSYYITAPHSGVITAGTCEVVDAAGSSAGTSTIYIDKNSSTTSQTVLTSAVVTNVATSNYSNTSLSLPVAAGDKIGIQFSSAAWGGGAANPTNLNFTCILYAR